MSPSGAARSAAIVGFLLAGAAILLIGFFLDNRGPNHAVPPLRILSPDTAEVVRNPVVVQFVTPANLRLTPAGWTAGPLHLHVIIDGQELMPGAADISASADVFTWRLPPLQPGPHRIYLTWAGQHHGNLPGSTDTVTLRVAH